MTLPAPGPARPGAPPSRADVVVIGGGLPGLAAARWLAEAGVDVLLIEAGPTLGAGASGQAPGLVHKGLVEHPWRTAASLGDAACGELLRFSAESLHLAEALGLLTRTGLLWAAVEGEREPAELERSAATLQRLGFPADVRPAPQVDAAVGGVGFGPGLWCPDEGLLHPSHAVAALAHAAEAAGARLLTGCAARATSPLPHGLRVDTAQGPVAAEAVVLAAEAGLPAVEPWLAHAIQPVREQAIALAGGPALPAGLRAGFGYTTGRTLDDHLVLSGCRWATPHMEVGEADPHTLAPAVQERLEATARRFFPSAGQVVARWAWITGQSCDGLPLVGPLPGDPRRVVCAGFGGNEAGLGLRAARAVVDGLLHGRADGVPALLAPDRLL